MQVSPAAADIDRRSLRFRDPETEAAYRRVATVADREMRIGPFLSIGLWLVGGALAAASTSAPAAPIYAVAIGMAAANACAALAAGKTRTYERQQLVGAGLNVLAGLAVLGLAALTGTFDAYAAPALMLVALFAFLVLRLRFAFALLVSVVDVAAYLVFAIAAAAHAAGLNLFLVSATVLVATGATHVLEERDRRLFAQGRLIASLHQQVDSMFRRYLSPDVASALLEGGGDVLGGELVEATILFADLQGFTSLSERSDPRLVVELLNAYFEAAVPAIFAQGGSVVGFAGDAIVAIFNAPQRQPDHALRAARAALALQAAVEALRIEGPRPRFRVGLNTGEVVVGSIGSTELRNFTAIGDATNVAARLQTYAQPGQVVLGDQTYAQLGTCAEVVALGAPALKGKTETIAVYQLVALCPEVESPTAAV
jgi:class 3 adenylate cyclase